MTYLKATVVGILVGLLSAVLWVSVDVFLPVYWESRGGGLASVSVSAGSALLVAFIGFLAGFIWTVRRARATN